MFLKEYRVLIVRFQSNGLLITSLREQEQMIMLIIIYTSQPDGSNLQCICHKEAQIEQNHKNKKMQERVNRKTNTGLVLDHNQIGVQNQNKLTINSAKHCRAHDR